MTFFGRAQGPTATGFVTTRRAPQVTFEFIAAGPISVGSPVQLALSDPTGSLVIETQMDPFQDHRVVGVYIGVGGRGSYDDVFGGRAALSGDVIEVLVYGYCPKLRMDAFTQAGADGDAGSVGEDYLGTGVSLRTNFARGRLPVYVILTPYNLTGFIIPVSVFVKNC